MRRRRQCNEGHEIGGDNLAKVSSGYGCKICYEKRRAREFAQQAWADWVIIKHMLDGRDPGRPPTMMEILVAAKEQGPGGRGQGTIHGRIGVSQDRYEAARQWAQRNGVDIPTFGEVFYSYYRKP